MEWLFIIVLGAVLYGLWSRVTDLDKRVQNLQDQLWSVNTRPSPEDTAGSPPQPSRTTEKRAEPTARPASTETALSAPSSAKEEKSHRLSEEPDADPGPDRGPDLDDNIGAEPAADARASGFTMPRFDFEDLFGRRLPIWAGGIALAAGGIFLVIYAIENGVMGPVTRTILSFVFGVLLLLAAEAAFRFEDRVADPRVRQALAGAGIATLYAAFYLAGARFGLIGPAPAFAGLALVTAGALALTFRFGLPTAVLGLVGGFATPMLVASDDANVPVLAFYLALLTAGLALTAKRLGYRWLGFSALAGGSIWGALMVFANPQENADIIAIGLYLLALGAVVPLLLEDDERLPLARLAAGGIAAVQLGSLVALAGFDLLTWGLYLLLAAALAVLGWRTAVLRPAGALVGAVGAILLILWPDPPTNEFILVAIGYAVITLGTPLALLWRKDGAGQEMVQLCVVAVVLGWICHFHFGNWDNRLFLPGLSAALVILSALAGAGALKAWRSDDLGRYLPLPVAVSALLAFGAMHAILPDWAEVAGAVIVTLVLAELLRRRPRKSLRALAWIGGVMTLVTLLSTGNAGHELSRAVGDPYGEAELARSLTRWIIAALPFVALALLDRQRWPRHIAEALSGLICYVVLAQIIPGEWLAWMAGLAALSLAIWQPKRTGLWSALVAVGLLWAAYPLGLWVIAGIKALQGIPMLVGSLPQWDNVLRYVLPVAIASGLAGWQMGDRPRIRRALFPLGAVIGLLVVHVLYKQIFAIDDDLAFASLGMAERTTWQVLLTGAGIALARLLRHAVWQRIGTMLAVAGLLHFLVFTLVLHNPLWSTLQTGPLAFANWLAPSYCIAAIAVWWVARRGGDLLRKKLRIFGDTMLMLLISLWSLSELRHAYAGSVLTAVPLSQGEDLFRSLLGIVLALAFLWWGSRAGLRSWRIGSLVLMLLAVLKVFLVDAAGLEGLLRIASFLALGFSLMGIGWIYSRQLSNRGPARPVEEPEV